MARRPTQEKRMAQLTTPLGQDELILSSFNAQEELSKPFEIRIDCLSQTENIDFNAALGQQCNVKLRTLDGKTRYFSGRLVEASWFGERDGMFSYQLVLRPWLWLLTQTNDCRIFQNMSVIEIIRDVFDRLGFPDYADQTTETYPKIEYCVQYRESCFNFVSRLMEQFGIYYYFKHTDSKHDMQLADAKSSHEAVPDLPICKFEPMGERTRDDKQYLTTILSGRMVRTGKITLNGYDFAKPPANLKTDTTSPGGYTHDAMEVYDYPEKYKNGQQNELGQKFAKSRLHASQSMDRRRETTGNAPSLFPGGLVTLDQHKTSTENIEYLVVVCAHSYMDGGYSSGSGNSGGAVYSGTYVLQPSDRPYKAPHLSHHPIIAGPQTATVVGPAGEEIHTDEHGRIKIEFHWDRESPGNDKASRWVRVAQIASGNSWGGIVIPRIGMEVVVEFIEGDPDRPIVVGTVYNGDNKPPYSLPANKTQTGVKTRSSKGGSDSNYNEFMFEDKKGVEFIRMHAEKDLDVTIEDAEKRILKGKNKKTEGETTRQTVIERGDNEFDVKGDDKYKIGRHQVGQVVSDRTVKVGGDDKLDVTGVQDIMVHKTIKIEAMQQIVLKVGSSTITMTPASIEIKTNMLHTDAQITKVDSTTLLAQKSALITLN